MIFFLWQAQAAIFLQQVARHFVRQTCAASLLVRLEHFSPRRPFCCPFGLANKRAWLEVAPCFFRRNLHLGEERWGAVA